MINLNDSDIFGTNETIPEKTGEIEKIHIREILKELGSPVESLCLGDFDFIGEFTAKKQRSTDSQEYKKAGAFFRPNYERGLLIHALIKKYDIETYLEIGYGRGYSSICAAMTMSQLGRGEVITIDPALQKEQVENLSKVLPNEWLSRIRFYQSTSDEFFSSQDKKFDMAFIDGDHRYSAVKNDWENVIKNNPKVILLDDYHLLSKQEKDIEVSNLVDSLDEPSKRLVIMDRRIFLDDRRYTDEEIDYGQVLIVK